MSKRFLRNREYLELLATSKPQQRIRLLKRAEPEQLKAIIESIVNIERLTFSEPEAICLNKQKKTLEIFKKQNWKDLKKSKNIFLKHQLALSRILLCVIVQQEEDFLSTLENDSDL